MGQVSEYKKRQEVLSSKRCGGCKGYGYTNDEICVRCNGTGLESKRGQRTDLPDNSGSYF